MEKGRIIFLNGVTSAGKTSIVEAMQERGDREEGRSEEQHELYQQCSAMDSNSDRVNPKYSRPVSGAAPNL